MKQSPSTTQSTGGASPHQPATCAAALLRALHRPAIAGLYLHVPFCFHKCHYCDFYSLVDTHDRQAAFVDRMIGEMRILAPLVRGQIRTIFVGGGTPTLLAPALWQRLLVALREHLDLTGLREFTVEANPETLTSELLETLAAGGVNRMSMGAQSFDARHLKTLERWHAPENVARALKLARAAGITNLNIDLIFAIPGQSLDEWRNDLARAIDLGTTHLSCYSLMYEPNTALTRKMELGMVQPADNALEAAMFEATLETLTAAGFEHYEVSNFASGSHACRCEHNLLYWRNENWLAIGPSGSAHVDGLRWKNVPHLGRYLASPVDEGCGVQDVERLDVDASVGEQLMLRLRLIEGVEHGWVEANVGPGRMAIIEQHVASGMLERTERALRLTRAGLMMCDDVVGALL